MYNASLRIVNDPGEAEDIMQDSFLSAFEKIDQYSGMVSFGAWLKRIVINRSIDIVKKRKMHFEEINDDRHGEIATEEASDSEDVHQSIERIKACMEKLADGYRLILSLYLFEGYDHEEIGEIMNISSSTSRSQFTRAKKKLLEIMN
jgi:RNA polymerase sigma-70 factor (ECF subfamily)